MALFASRLTQVSAGAVAAQREAWAKYEAAVLKVLLEAFMAPCQEHAKSGKWGLVFQCDGVAGAPLDWVFPKQATTVPNPYYGRPRQEQYVPGPPETTFEKLPEGQALPIGTWWCVSEGEDYQQHASAAPKRADVVQYFVDRLEPQIQGMGFSTVSRQGAALTVAWAKPSGKMDDRQAVPGNVSEECAICHETHILLAASPCGHLACHQCLEKLWGQKGSCAFCESKILGMQKVFSP